jgi:hypothetical protein
MSPGATKNTLRIPLSPLASCLALLLLLSLDNGVQAFRGRSSADPSARGRTADSAEAEAADLLAEETLRDLSAGASGGPDPRFFFANFTSSLIAVNTTLLAYGLIALGILVAAAVAVYYIWVESTSRSGTAGGGGYGQNAGYGPNAYGYQKYAR